MSSTLNNAKLFLSYSERGIPEVEISPNTSVYVAVPLHRELSNVKRLFHSWNNQHLPDHINAEVVFFVNGRASDNKDTYEENDSTFQILSTLTTQEVRPNLGMHVIDAYSRDHAIPDHYKMGWIRNAATVPIVRHYAETGTNAIIQGTDADSFPSPNLVTRLHGLLQERKSVYGSVDRYHEFESGIPEGDCKSIEDIYLIQIVHDILWNYIAFGTLDMQVSLAGSSTFYTLDNFVNIFGYQNVVPEDTDLSVRLRATYPDREFFLDDAFIVNTTRFSDRVDGDGKAFAELRDSGYRIDLNAEVALPFALLSRWATVCEGVGIHYEDGRKRLNLDELFIDQSGQQRQSIANALDSFSPESGYEGVLRNVLAVLREDVNVTPQQAIESYAALTHKIFGEHREFLKLIKENSDARNYLHALITFVKTKQ